MLVLDEALNVVRVNQATLDLTEACDEPLLDHDPASETQCGSILACVHDADDPRGCGFSAVCPLCPLRNGLQQLISTGSTVRGAEMAFDIDCKGGTRRLWLRVGAERVAMNGEPHVVVALDDVTEEKRSEQALRESEELYRVLTETMSDVVWIADIDELRFVYVSPSVERARGFTPAEVLAQPPESTVTPGTWAVMAPRFLTRADAARSASSGTQSYYVDEIEQPRSDGSTMWSEIVTAWTVNPVSGHVEARGVSRDITQRRLAEQALRASESHFRAFFEQAAVGMVTTSPDGGLVEINGAMLTMLGYTEAELRDTSWRDVTHPDDVGLESGLSGRLVAGEIDDYSLDKRLVRKDGVVVHAHLAVRAVRDANGEIDYVAAVVEDITDRVRAEAALRESERRFAEFAIHVPGELWIRDADMRYVYVNPRPRLLVRRRAGRAARPVSGGHAGAGGRPDRPRAQRARHAARSLTSRRSGRRRTARCRCACASSPSPSRGGGRWSAASRSTSPKSTRPGPGPAPRRAPAPHRRGRRARHGPRGRDPRPLHRRPRTPRRRARRGHRRRARPRARPPRGPAPGRPHPRHRQDRRAGRDPRQAGAPQRGRVQPHPPARPRRLRDPRRHRVRRPRGRDRPAAPRAHRRQRLPRGPRRRGRSSSRPASSPSPTPSRR